MERGNLDGAMRTRPSAAVAIDDNDVDPSRAGEGSGPETPQQPTFCSKVLKPEPMEVIDVLHNGLAVCDFCGAVRGTTRGGRVSLCLCDGIACRYCGLGRTYRPCSDHFDWRTRTFWHMPYFGAGHPCDPCAQLARQADPTPTFPGVLGSDPRLRSLLAAIRDAHEGLVLRSVRPTGDSDRAAIIAAYAPKHLWRELGLRHPPDDRPLWIGHASNYVESPYAHVRIASWTPEDRHDPVELITELDRRWRPPFRKYLPWDPSEHFLALDRTNN
jgi:hypothetical protein